MLFDSVMLARIAANVKASAVGAPIGRVFLNGEKAIAIDLRRRLPASQLLISWSVQFGRVHFTDDAAPETDLTSAFGDVLRKYLRGATLTGCRQIMFDRQLHLEFANCRRMGPEARATLVCEIMGRHSNVVLVDEDNSIINCAKPVPADINRYRQILPGREYVPPPLFERRDPHEVDAADLQKQADQHLDMQFWKFVRETVIGGSDVFLDEVAARAGIDPEARLRDFDENWAERTCDAIGSIVSEAEGDDGAYFYEPPESDDRSPFAYPLDLQSYADVRREQWDNLSAAIVECAKREKQGQQIRQMRQRLKTVVEKALETASARVRERENVLANAENADAWRKRGELLLAHLHEVPPGASEITLTDYYDPEQSDITIQLHPDKPPQQDAEAMFDRYKRAKRIQERVPKLLRKAEIEQEYLEGVLQQIEMASDTDDLDQLEQELAREGYISEQRRDKKRKRKSKAGKPRRAKSTDDYPLLYGKTGMENDAVVRAANADDIWLHVKQGPGGHVVIRTNGEPGDVPESTIHQAAALAAHLSKWSNDTKADVNYTLARHVNKPGGAPPGFVTYTDFDTVTVEPMSLE